MGRLSTIDLLELTSFDQLLSIFKTLFFYNRSYPYEEVNCTETSLLVSFPCLYRYRERDERERKVENLFSYSATNKPPVLKYKFSCKCGSWKSSPKNCK